MGFFFGAGMNVLMVQAVTDPACPSPGLPIAIIGVNSLAIYLMTPALVRLWPGYFQTFRFDAWTLFFLVMVITGLIGIVARQK
jgi:hypothetical protein